MTYIQPPPPTGSLFALTRASDPKSSHDAAANLTASGGHDAQCAAVLAALREHDGATGAELAREMDADLHMVRRRLPDLRNRGEARNGDERTCRVAGTVAMTWWVGGVK